MPHRNAPAMTPAELVEFTHKARLLPLPFALVHLPRPLHTAHRVTGGQYFEVQVRLQRRGVVYGAFTLCPGDTPHDFSRKLREAYQACRRAMEGRKL